MKIKRNNNNIFLIIGFMFLIILAWNSTYNAYDNDLWWLLATGREIANNGIPYINPWSMHEGLSIIVQQWLSSLILYFVYSSCGMLGIKIYIFIQILILFSFLLILFRVSSNKNINPIISIILISILFISLSIYTRSRPHLWSMISYTIILIVLEKYRRNNNKIILSLIPVVVLFHSNLHISMAPFDLFLIGLYCLPSLNFKTLNITYYYSNYKRKPLLIILFISCIVMLINPYGIDGALYLLKSYGVADYAGYIKEMNATILWDKYCISLIFSLIIGLLYIGFRGIKRFDLPVTILFISCALLSIQHIRNIWLLPLFSIPLLADCFSHININLDNFKIINKKPFKVLISICCILILIGLIYPDLHQLPIVTEADDDDNVPILAVEYLDSYTSDNDICKDSLKIYNSFNHGGILEWYGYKVFMDPRPELWESAITGVEEHYYYEFVNFSLGNILPETLINKYNFDFILAYDNTGTLNNYLNDENGYHIVVNGNGYNLWEKDSM